MQTPAERGALRFSETQAARIITVDETEPARAFFDALGTPCATAAARSFAGFKMALLIRNPDNYGLYFYHQRVQTPFLWFGLAWNAKDPPGTMPSWGASLEVNGEAVQLFEEGLGGLREAMEAVGAGGQGPIRLYRFGGHVELAQWKPFSWLLPQEDQVEALLGFWRGYLRALAQGQLPAAGARFIAAAPAAAPAG